ncbi:helix-turn-helix domain-containing protein [Pollutibacter soli]|uniref:helix-turn-helix domain-containing protein n=1 Tax=Pollutibacter soli TaxID=3034157 RepID=UPI003014041E
MSQQSIQQLLFDTIKSRYPANKSLVSELATILNISQDSAYRRMRGEKTITLEEVQSVCVRFGISVDQLMHQKSQNYLFQDHGIGEGNLSFNEQLELHFAELSQIKKSSSAELFFFTRDISIFYFYQFPELLAFKYFYWMKSVFGHPDYQRLKFAINDELNKYSGMGVKAAKSFTEIDGTEIWSLENISQILQQFRYLRELQLFSDPSELSKLYHALIRMIDHIEMQADAGKKFFSGKAPDEHSGRFNLYINEFMHGGNNILVRAGEHWMAYINHSIMNYLRTEDPEFCTYVKQRIQEVMKRSDLISGTGEKLRRQFFNRLRDRVRESHENK